MISLLFSFAFKPSPKSLISPYASAHHSIYRTKYPCPSRSLQEQSNDTTGKSGKAHFEVGCTGL